MGEPWTDEDEQKLKELWPRKDQSAATIAKLMHRTRNAIIGKAHRIGLAVPYKTAKQKHLEGLMRRRQYVLEGGRPPAKSKPPAKPATPFNLPLFGNASPKDREKKPPTPVADTPVIAQSVDSVGVPFLEATSTQCKAIIGLSDDRYGFPIYCGNPVDENCRYSFCPDHMELYTVKRIRR